MRTTTRSSLATLRVAVRTIILATLVLGVGYTLAITGIAQVIAPSRADGSPVTRTDGSLAGSSLIGQSFTDADGRAIARYFQSRPSAAGDGYDAGASGGSNQGPENPELINAISQRRTEIAERENVAPAQVPADALTASGSGLDPHISPAYASIQIARVAHARGMSTATVRNLVDAHTDRSVVGPPVVDVLSLNLALDGREG